MTRLSLLALGCALIMVALKVRRRTRSDHVSPQWLKEQDRLGDRIEFHGVIKWPINKILDDSPLWNREQQRKRA